MKRQRYSSRAPASKAPPPPSAPRRRRSEASGRSILDDEVDGTIVVRWTIDGSVIDMGDGFAELGDAIKEEYCIRIKAAIGAFFADLSDRGARLKLFDGVSVEADVDSIEVTDGPFVGRVADVLDSLDLENEGEGLDPYWWQRRL